MVDWKPEGYHSVTPYLVVPDAAGLLGFVQKVFGADEAVRMDGPDGKVAHAEVRIGDSVVMISDANPETPAMPGMLNLYVEDCDAAFGRALVAGATSVRDLEEQWYGDRSGGVRDPFGNVWWISTHIEDVSPEEGARRAAEFTAKQAEAQKG